MLDAEGHLAFTEGGDIYPGLCHCARNGAHYAEWSKPEGGWVIERSRSSLSPETEPKENEQR